LKIKDSCYYYQVGYYGASMNYRYFLISVLIFLIGSLLFCSTKIDKLHRNPHNYIGKHVTIKARIIATRDIPFSSTDYYKITDDTGEIWVSTTKGIPTAGIKYRINGCLVKIDDEIKKLIWGEYILSEIRREEL